MKDICLTVQKQNRICTLESLQNWSVLCILNMTFPETALADHFVALGFKQAGTRFLVLRQKAAASDNSLGSVRHLLHISKASGDRIWQGFFVWYLWEAQHNSSISPHSLTWHLIHIPASQRAPAAPQNCKIIASPCSKDHRDTLPICCTSAFCL